jgi:hypothetical protein
MWPPVPLIVTGVAVLIPLIVTAVAVVNVEGFAPVTSVKI